ncbi:Putative cytochrome P450 138 [Paraconexibacter sp. AEG42_29]|uniref:Cytochrome P450 138 n=1 Tax=Paraconexibacter sp. AEG42_29 TaxID=2997339 RepID=A0AAU7ARZ2_9ACTN
MSSRAVLPPGPAAPPLVQTARWVRDPVTFFERCRNRYGRRFTVRFLFGPPIVSLSDPAEVKAIFGAPPDVLEPGFGGKILEPVLGSRSVLVLDGDDHLRQRRLMLPAFHGERMATLTGVLEEVTERAVAEWPRDRPIELHPRLQALTLEVILRAVFGLEPGPRLDALRTVFTAYLEEASKPHNMPTGLQRDLGRLSPWGRFLRVREQALGLVSAEIARRRTADQGDHGDVLAMLLGATEEDGTPMRDLDIRDELVTLLVAGHETTASQLAWTCERLVRTPDVLARAQAAVDAGDDAYLTATIQEALRCRPVLMFAQPRFVARPITVGDVAYPAGSCALTANVHLVHHDPDIYPDPYAFRPERFLEQAPGTFTWLPFGGGRRRCLGQAFAMLEMRVVLAALLRTTDLARDPAAAPGDEAHLRRHITVSPAEGARLVLQSRRTTRPAAAAA